MPANYTIFPLGAWVSWEGLWYRTEIGVDGEPLVTVQDYSPLS